MTAEAATVGCGEQRKVGNYTTDLRSTELLQINMQILYSNILYRTFSCKLHCTALADQIPFSFALYLNGAIFLYTASEVKTKVRTAKLKVCGCVISEVICATSEGKIYSFQRLS